MTRVLTPGATVAKAGAKAKPQDGHQKPSLGWTSCTSSSSRLQDPQRAPMLIGLTSSSVIHSPPAVLLHVVGEWWWSVVLRAPVGGGAPRVLQPVGEDVQAGGEPLVAVVEPDVLAEGDQGGEAVGRQRAEELVQLGSGRRVADALLVDGGEGC
jgi:hypothetical protein